MVAMKAKYNKDRPDSLMQAASPHHHRFNDSLMTASGAMNQSALMPLLNLRDQRKDINGFDNTKTMFSLENTTQVADSHFASFLNHTLELQPNFANTAKSNDLKSSIHLAQLAMCSKCQSSVGQIIEQTLIRAIAVERDRIEKKYEKLIIYEKDSINKSFQSKFTETLTQ